MRAFIYAETENLDIDFYIYNSTNLTDIQASPSHYLVSYSISTYSHESKQITLPALPNPSSSNGDYTLQIYSFRNRLSSCTFLTFEFGLLPGDTVINDLGCPGTLPTPEYPNPSLTFYPNSMTIMQNQDYLFTEYLIDNYLARFPGNQYVFPMSIVSHSNFTLSVMLSFNFIENDFGLRMKDSDNNLISEGRLRSLEDRSSYVNFQSYLLLYLTPGVYSLEIVETLTNYSFLNVTGTPNLCHKFQFYLLSNNDDAVAVIDNVFPSYANNMQVSNDLIIKVEFSVPIVSPALNEWTNFLQSNAPFYLTDTKNNTIYPNITNLELGLQTIIVVFNKSVFQYDETYRLTILAEKFSAHNGTRFSLLDSFSEFIYKTKSCGCGIHGTCGPNEVCICRTPYTGAECLNCIEGYHSAGTVCIENTKCDANSCNGNGKCDDSLGFPVCDCNEGYATLGEEFCSICAYGYSDYPQCYSNSNSSNPYYCDLHLLPTSFDGPGYLGDNGRLYLQDEFFIDISNRKHSITFSLKQDSMVRVYVEPHQVDIDLW